MIQNTYLPIRETIKIAWAQVKGSKASIWAAILISSTIIAALIFFDYIIRSGAPSIAPIVSFIIQVIVFLLGNGIIFIGIRCAQNLPVSYRMMFRSFESKTAISAIGVFILQSIILVIPLAILIISCRFLGILGPGDILDQILLFVILCWLAIIALIYLYTRTMFSVFFVLDKGTNPWQSIIQSFAITKGNFWRISTLLIIQTLIVIASAIPLFIGLIWTIPVSCVLLGAMYNYLSQAQNI